MCTECDGSGKTHDTRRSSGLYSDIIHITGICSYCETGRKLSEGFADQELADRLNHRNADNWASEQMELSHKGHENEDE